MVCCHGSKLEVLFKQSKNCPALRIVVKMGSEISPEEKEMAEQNGVKLFSMDEVEVCVLCLLPVYTCIYIYTDLQSLIKVYTVC